MNTNKFFLLLTAAATLLPYCKKDDVSSGMSATAVQITRASGTAWDDADQIGVFMKTAGSALGATKLADNVLYTHSEGAFTAAEPIYFPLSGAVDFVAYHPWRATPATTPYIYKVDVATQTTPGTIDLLWSAEAKGKSKTTSVISLTFKHMLSKIALNIVAGKGLTAEDLADMKVKITGMPTNADFSLANGTLASPSAVADIVPRTVTEGSAYEAILIPQLGTSGRAMVFTVSGQDFTYAIPATDDFAPGKTYPYTITVSKTDITVSREDAAQWTLGEDETGTAVKVTVAAGDYYYSDGGFSTILNSAKTCIGIVVRTQGQGGIIMSLDEGNLQWSTENAVTNAIFEFDGNMNMASIRARPGWEDSYPAFKWCADKGAGWYLPAKNQLIDLYAFWAGDPEALNTRLVAVEGIPLTDSWYWCSVENTDDEATGVDFNGQSAGILKENYGKVRAYFAF